MGTTTANMGLSVPTLNGDSGTWDTQINASFTLLDAHRHVAGEGVQIPTAGILLNADLTFGGYAATNLKATRYSVQTVSPGTFSVYFKGVDAYVADGNGVEVRLTASGGVNVSIAGGITGDYVSAAASFYYDDAAKSYLALQLAPAPNAWASLSAGDLDLYEKTSGSATRVRLSSPAALAASYAMTYPAALPATTSLFQVTSAGVMTFSNTVVKAVTMSELTTFSAGATASANQHFTVSGTGEYKHGAKGRPVPVSFGAASGGTFGDGKFTATGAATIYLPLILEVGERITGMTYAIDGDGVVTFTVSVDHYSATGTKTQIGAASGTTPSATPTTFAIAGLTATTLATHETVVVKVTFSAANGVLFSVDPSFTRP